MNEQLVKLTSHEQRVVDYITQHGSISSKQAMEEIGEGRLSATIKRLRDKGYNIETVRIDTVNRYGEPTWFGRYIFGH